MYCRMPHTLMGTTRPAGVLRVCSSPRTMVHPLAYKEPSGNRSMLSSSEVEGTHTRGTPSRPTSRRHLHLPFAKVSSSWNSGAFFECFWCMRCTLAQLSSPMAVRGTLVFFRIAAARVVSMSTAALAVSPFPFASSLHSPPSLPFPLRHLYPCLFLCLVDRPALVPFACDNLPRLHDDWDLLSARS